MDLSKNKISGLVCVICLLTFVGCDQLMPKPKAPAKPQASATTGADLAADIVSATSKDASDVVDEDAPLPPNVVARVGSWTLTVDDLDSRLEGVKQAFEQFDENAPGAKGMVRDELIRQQLMVQEAKAQGIDKMEDIRNAVEDFENTLLVQELAGRLTRDIAVTEVDARLFYEDEENTSMFMVPVEKKLREVVVLTEAEAKDIYVQILQGADFATMATERSQGKSADNAGDLGYLQQTPFEAMQKEIENLKKNETSRVFEGPEGFYIVKVEDIRGGDKRPFEDIKEELVKGLTLQGQQKAIFEKMAEVAEKVKVKVNADLFKE